MFNPNEHLMPLKGKAYLEVKWRLVWFREDHPDWNIDTALVKHNEEKNSAIFYAKIYDQNGIQKASGYGSESAKDFADYLEKAETKAIGRALAMLGYGTQFAPELEEGERIVDAPVERKSATPAAPIDPLEIVLNFGKHKGESLGSLLQTANGRQYVEWLRDNDKCDPGLREACAIVTGYRKAGTNGG